MIQPKPHSKYSNGQILAIGAFTISILLLGIAVNLNTALHTNYSAIESIDSTEESIESYLTEHNLIVKSHHKQLATETGLSYIELNNQYQSMHNKTTASIAKQYLTKGITVSSTYESSENGFMLYQLDQNNITSRTGASDWQFVDSVDEYNKFKFIADIESLTGTSNPNESNAFHIEVSDSGTVEHRIYFYKNSSGEGVIETRDNSGSSQYICTFNNLDNSAINLYAETVNSDGCAGLSVIETGNTLQIQNGNILQGEYIFKGKGTLSNNIDTTNYHSDSSDKYPQQSRILYSTTSEIVYQNGDSEITQSRTVTTGDIYDI